MKKCLSMMLVLVLVFSMVPMFSFAADTQGVFGPVGTVVGMGITYSELGELKGVLEDYYDFRGSAEDAITAVRADNETLTTILDNNGVDISTSVEASETFFGLVEGDTDLDTLVEGMVELKTNYSTVISNLQDNYRSSYDFEDNGGTRAATYAYYLGKVLQSKKILKFDDNGNELEFVFASKLSNSTTVGSHDDTTYTLNDYIKMALTSSSDLDDLDQTLEDSLNDELNAYLNSGENDYTAKDIATIAQKMKLVNWVDTTPDEDEEEEEDTGGSTTPTDDTTTDDATDDDEEVIEDKDELKDTTDTLEESIEEKDSDEVVSDIDKVIDSADKLFDDDENKEGVKETVDKTSAIIDKFIDREDVDSDTAKGVTKNFIEKNIAKVVKDAKTTKNDINKFKKKTKNLVNKTIKKSGTLDFDKEKKIEKDSIKTLITKMKETTKELKDSLKNSEVTGIDKFVEENVNIKTQEDAELKMDKDVVKELKDSKVGLSVESKDTKVVLSNDNLEDIGEEDEIEVKAKEVSEAANKNLNKQADEESFKFLKTKDIEVNKVDKDGNKTQIPRVRVSFDVSEYINGDSDKLSLLVVNSQTGLFEIVNSWVVDNELQGLAPHYSYYTIAEYTPKFKDIEKHWANPTIIKMAAKGIVNGKTEETFAPDGDITRAEFVTMLVNAFDIESNVAATFKDTSEDDWYFSSVNTAFKLGLVNGVGKGNFAPNAKITRQDMVVMMANFYNYEADEALTSDVDAFADINSASSYAKEAINGAGEIEIVSGYGNNKFMPTDYATRAEALKMIDNLLVYLK